MKQETKSRRWKLATCGRCEWITSSMSETCEKCGWGLFLSAYYVYGDKAYEYRHSQTPWKEKKMAKYSYDLDLQINDTRPKNKTPESRLLDSIFSGIIGQQKIKTDA